MDFKGTFKVDFKEARENSGLSLNQVENFLEPMYKVNLAQVEENNEKVSEGYVQALMGVYGLPAEHMKDYYAKYTK